MAAVGRFPVEFACSCKILVDVVIGAGGGRRVGGCAE